MKIIVDTGWVPGIKGFDEMAKALINHMEWSKGEFLEPQWVAVHANSLRRSAELVDVLAEAMPNLFPGHTFDITKTGEGSVKVDITRQKPYRWCRLEFIGSGSAEFEEAMRQAIGFTNMRALRGRRNVIAHLLDSSLITCDTGLLARMARSLSSELLVNSEYSVSKERPLVVAPRGLFSDLEKLCVLAETDKFDRKAMTWHDGQQMTLANILDSQAYRDRHAVGQYIFGDRVVFELHDQQRNVVAAVPARVLSYYQDKESLREFYKVAVRIAGTLIYSVTEIDYEAIVHAERDDHISPLERI